MASNPAQSGPGGSGQQRQSRVSEIAASHHRRNDDSWVELASQPSSSSLSSIGDEIVTTGLRVGNSSYPPRRRRLPQTHNHMPSTYIVSHAAAQAGSSSQEEYDETESSEEDHILTSSTEQLGPSASLPRQQTAIGPSNTAASDEDDDDDENATALGRPSSSPTFRPQPNAFSHPPSHLQRHSTSSAVHHHHPSSRPPAAQRSHTRPNRGAPNLLSPSYQADNDAALRASLTTLLSCAAAARGLPKKDTELAGPSGAGMQRSSTQPMELRFAAESELMGDGLPGPSTAAQTAPPPGPIPHHLCPQAPGAATASNSSAPSAPSSASSRSREPAIEKTVKRPSTSTARARSPRAAKKKRTAADAEPDAASATTTLISPSVLTWVVSAGVLVLVSVVGFGAGYVIGREVGRQEASTLGGMSLGGDAAAAGNASSCGREVIRSTSSGTLRRFRWGTVGKSVAA